MTQEIVSSVPPRQPSKAGAALVIILAFIVILLTIVLAFISWSSLQQQVSLSSTNASSVDVLARGAVESVVGDLLQEIAAGSSVTNVVTGTVRTTLYYPATNSNMVPSLSGFTTNAGLENIVKVSSTNPVFRVATSSGGVSNGPMRGINSASTNVSFNGRSVSPLRWNRSLLIGRKATNSATDWTPVDAFNGAIPQWVLIARNGSNPTTWNSDMRWSPTNGTTVIGRYAYIIHNEGGLLDANVAGYPPSLTNSAVRNPAYVPYKTGSYFADLTQIGLNTTQINALVGWRNNTSANATGSYPSYTIPGYGTNYAAAMLSDTNGLNICRTSSTSSDRRFTSRQQLIEFLKSADPSSAANGLNSLAYLGTFTRSLDQPTYFWDTNRPKIMAPGYLRTGSGAAPDGDYVWGGNSAHKYDDLVNPSFATIRVKTEFIRYDGTKALIGEPLVKYRFPLSRLAWLTCKGPSALLNSSDPVIQQLLNNGVSLDTIKNGTAANILKCFGLTWTPGPGTGGIGGSWTYNHGIPNVVGTLSAVADLVGANAREPDFFELLKAGLAAGSLAKGGQNSRQQTPLNIAVNGELDTSIDLHVLQIGANIIAQASVDAFPTSITFDDGRFSPPIWGVNDLPYFQGLVNMNILVKKASIIPAPTISAGNPPDPVANATLSDPGRVVKLFVPIVWNPHDGGSAASVPSSLRPANLRICISSLAVAQPIGSTFANVPFQLESSYYFPPRGGPPPRGPYIVDPATITPAPWNVGTREGLMLRMPASGAPGNTALTYNYSSDLYREPTVLMQPGIPAGSNATLDAGNVIGSRDPSWNDGIPEWNSNQKFIGFYAGEAPSAWTATGTYNGTYAGNYTFTRGNGTTGNVTFTSSRLKTIGGSPTISMEYWAGGKWIPYQQVCVSSAQIYGEPDFSVAPSDCVVGSSDTYKMEALNSKRWQSSSANPRPHWTIAYSWDPRTRRWNTVGSTAYGPLLDSTKNTISSQRPGSSAGVSLSGSVFSEMGADNKIGFYSAPSSPSNWSYFSAAARTGHYYFVNPNGYAVDADGVIRLGMAAAYNSSVATTNGLPLATPAAPSSRPIMLNRPFRNVGELGYVFSDTPWRNIDFSTPESGCSALLDIFCIQENVHPDAFVAGKVDLNTRQVPVIKALIAGGCRDELALKTGADSPLASGEADALASSLVARTSGTASGVDAPGPLRNVGDLVGRWVSGVANSSSGLTPYNAPIASQPIYDGFSKDLASYYSNSSTSVNSRVQRFRNAPIRALAHSGQVGTWNLLIDIVVQTGKFPPSAISADQFQVQGETRYWVHVAIDRLTGKVLEKTIERVNE